MAELVSSFENLTANIFKLSYDRRAAGNQDRLQRLEVAYYAIPSDLLTPTLTSSYTRCKEFLTQCHHDEIKIKKSENQCEKSSGKMEFDVRTFNSVVPDFDGTSKDVIDFLDCAEAYNSLLKDSAKVTFLTFLVKVKLKGPAKAALTKTPDSLADFVKFCKARFRPRSTAASVKNELRNLQQGGKTVTNFASKIEVW